MSLSIEQQIITTIKNKQKILIAFRRDFSGDNIASALALSLWLKKLGKQSEITCDDFQFPRMFDFLPADKNIRPILRGLRKFVINLDLTKTKVNEFSYDVKNNNLQILISPEEGFFSKKDVTVGATNFRFDLMIVVGAPDLESLGKIYSANRELFIHRPVINLDHEPNNEHFGHINLVDFTAVSTTEVIYNLIKKTAPENLDADINTCLLTGIITETKSFRSERMTSRTLQVAGELIMAGARREEIVKNLYQNRALSTLKLWGRVLTKLKNELDGVLAWAKITQEDLRRAGANEFQLNDITDEIISNIPQLKLSVLFYEKADHLTGVVVNSLARINLLEALGKYNPKGKNNFVEFDLPASNEAEAGLINDLKNYWLRRN